MKIRIEIDALPQPRPRFSGGRCYESARISKYKKDIGFIARSVMKGEPPTEKPVKVKLKIWRKIKPTSRRYGDCDNLAKSILDACNGILWRDDAQIITLTAEKFEGKPRLEIEVLPT